MEKIKVSVIIPVYNEEKYISRCVESLLHQTFPMRLTEILFVDGCSTDGTREIIDSYGIRSFKIIENPKRIVTYALNTGIKHSSGDYIIRMDAHAEYAEDYIEKCLYYLEHTDADNVGGMAETKGIGYVGKANAEILSSRFGVGNSQFRIGSKDGYVDTVPFGAFRREIFSRVGMFNPDFPRSEDNDYNSRIRSHGGKIYLSSEIRFVYYCRDTVMGLLGQGIKNGDALFLTVRRNKHAMSLRHYIPFLFVVSLVFLLIMSMWFFLARALLISELGVYSILNLYYSFFQGGKRYAIYKLVMYPAFHISYGIGSLLGMFGIKLF